MNIWVVFTFWLLWIILLWTLVCNFLCRCRFSFLLGVYLEVIAGSYGNSRFNLLRNCQTVLQHSCIILHSHQQWCSNCSTSLPTLDIVSLFNLGHANLYLICIPLMINGVKYLSMCLLGILISPFTQYLLKDFAHF